jgi:predicted dehydrogenase
MPYKKVKVALIGSGNISYTYLNTLTTQFDIIDLVGCSDLIPEKSKARSELFGVKQLTTEQILNDPEIEIVLNTTEIFNHTAVTRMILEAGKSCYSEKSLGCDYEEAKANVDLAASKGLRLGSAPDIYLGSAYQTARKLIDDGWIGEPVTAQAWCIRGYGANTRPELPPPGMKHGQPGTTITYDMGGYYINVLVALLGAVNRVAGFAQAFPKHTYDNVRNPKFGQPIDTAGSGASVLMGALEFESGAYGNLVLMADGFGPEIPRVEIFGTKGTLTLPDPNCFGGWGNEVYMTRIGNEGTFKVPFTHGYSDADPAIPAKSGKREPCHNSNRGIAVADMAYAIRDNRPHRSSAELALHTVEIVSAIERGCTFDNKVYTMNSRPQRPAPLKDGLFGAVAEASLIL